jgi:hypothetical protein
MKTAVLTAAPAPGHPNEPLGGDPAPLSARLEV